MTRTPLILWCLLPLLASCASAGNGTSQTATTLPVRNVTATQCTAWIGGQPVADLPPRSLSLVRWLPPRPFALRWACGTESGLLQVEAQTEEISLGTAPAEAGPILDLTASIQIANPSAADFSVRLDGQLLGNVLAGNQALFRDLRAGTHQLQLLAAGSQSETTQEVELKGAETLQLSVPQCKSTLHILNDQPTAVEFELRDESFRVEPGAEHLWADLTAGEYLLGVKTSGSGDVMTLKVRLECGETREMRLNQASATLIIENRFDEALTVRLPGHEPLEVAANQTHQFPGLTPEPMVCEVRLASGRLLARELNFQAGQTLTWIVDAPLAELEVQNLVGERIVILDGTTPLADIPAGGAAALPVHPGPVSLSAWCPVTGHTSPIRVEVAKGQRMPLRVGPQGGRIRLENVTDEPLWAYRNGHFLGVIPPKVTAEFSGQPLGTSLVEITTSDGRLIARHKSDVATVQPSALAPTQPLAVSRQVVDVTLYNDTGEPLKLDPTLGGALDSMQPGMRLLVQVPVADPHIRAKGLVTGLGYALRVEPTGASNEVHLLSQVAGVMVENQLQQTVELWIDGKHLLDLEAGKQAEVKDLPPDRHVLLAKTPGSPEPVQQTATILTPRSWFRWVIRPNSVPTTVQNRSGEEVEVQQGQEVAGRLYDSSQVTLPSATGDVTLTLKGEKSQQAVRVSLTPSANAQTVSLGTNLGTLAVWGLSGRSCDVELDGVALPRQPADAPEPMRVAAKPGERRILFRFDDGTVVERMVQVSPGIECAVRATPDAISLDVQNATQEAVTLWVADTQVLSLDPGQSTQLSLPTDPQPPKVEAKAASGKRVWLLSNVALPGAGKFGWVISE